MRGTVGIPNIPKTYLTYTKSCTQELTNNTNNFDHNIKVEVMSDDIYKLSAHVVCLFIYRVTTVSVVRA